MKKIAIIVPCYNEEQVLPLFVAAICPVIDNPQYKWEVVLIDDGSSDATLSLMQQTHAADARFSYLELSRNFGKENALLAGLDYVQCDAAVIMDADLQHPVTVIPQLVEQWEQGYDDVYARRVSRGRESWLRKIFTKAYYRLLQSAANNNVYPNVGDFRLLDKACINALKAMRETDRYTKGLYAYIGFRKQFVDFVQEDRAAGKSKWSPFKLFKLALDGLFASSIKPLQLASKVGVTVSFAAFVYLVFVFVKALLYGDPVRGFPTLIIVILFLGGIQLLSIGLLGEYIGRIFNQSKHRPTYFVRSCNGSSIS